MRRVLKAIDRLVLAEEAQASALTRIADRFSPRPLPQATKDDLATTGPSYGRDQDFVKIEEFKGKVWDAARREPSEEEIIDFLDGREVRL